MANEKKTSEEDIPSDFFDDFAKEDFIESLSVIDSWDDENGASKGHSSRYNAETLESVDDIRQLLRRSREADRPQRDSKDGERARDERRSGSRLDEYIKPGSRRDPSKTKAAIKKDKEVKVKEYLAKHLEDDLRPPGTELDDFYNEKPLPTKAEVHADPLPPRPRSKEREQRRTNTGHQRTSDRGAVNRRRSPEARSRRSPPRRSPLPSRRSPARRSPRRSPARRSPRRNSPRRYSPRRSPRRHSPYRRNRYRQFSPEKRDRYRSRSRSPRWLRNRTPDHYRRTAQDDLFHYPPTIPMPGDFNLNPYPGGVPYPGPMMTDPNGQPFPPFPPNMPFPQSFNPAYNFGGQPMPSVPLPQPVPAPMMVHEQVEQVALVNPTPAEHPAPSPLPVQPPSATSQLPSPTPSLPQTSFTKRDTPVAPYDALAQLVAEGKLSQVDYLKLAPSKGSSMTSTKTDSLDTKTRVQVLNRCHLALSKLGSLQIPNRLLLNNNLICQDQKAIEPEYCSPLRRQLDVEFHFTKAGVSATFQHNKQLIDSIISTIGLNNVVSRPKKAPKNMKDAAVQTTKPYCDVCEIREATVCYDSATSVDPEHFSVSVHTQVVEEELVSSRAVFAPSGSLADGAPISISHLTPAQLVSQLAARAKTLKQTEPPPFRRPPYDYDRSGGYPYPNSRYRPM